jgi:DNA-binding NarL/FixJ family response regulator
MKKIRILIADDHELVREGMEALISSATDMEVVATASSGEEAINLVRTTQPEVVLMDIIMPGMNGIEAARWIKEIDETPRVILITMEVSKEYVSAGIKSGVDGYLPKDSSKETLLDAIRSVAGGAKYFNDAVKKLIFEDFYALEKLKHPKKVLPNHLTRRETEVLSLIASGKSNKDVAEDLFISVKTVETHKTHILIKLGLNNNSEIIRYAIKNKIVTV